MKKENILISYIKKAIYVILSFLQSLFYTNKKASIKEDKQIKPEVKKEDAPKNERRKEEASVATAMPEEPITEALLPFEKEFTKLFDKQIEEITGIKKKNATYNELYEINKIKKKLIPYLYQLETWNEFEMERWMHKKIIKDILENKSLPFKQDMLSEITEEEKRIVQEETKEDLKIIEPFLEHEEKTNTFEIPEEAEKVIDIKKLLLHMMNSLR